MTVGEALALNGLHVRLLLDWGDDDGQHVSVGRVVAVVVPCFGSPLEAHILLDRGVVSPFEVFLSDVVSLLYVGESPHPVNAPALSLVATG
jgi:hypothetical protein